MARARARERSTAEVRAKNLRRDIIGFNLSSVRVVPLRATLPYHRSAALVNLQRREVYGDLRVRRDEFNHRDTEAQRRKIRN